MPQKYREYFVSEADGLKISALAVCPDEKPYRGILQLVHGMSEHKERYEPFMEYMAAEGYLTVIHDHRGHGASIRQKEDLGYMYGGGAEAMLKDIETVNRELHKKYPDLPLILMGHSMGSLAVRAFAARHDESLDMLIICGSPSENKARALGQMIATAEKKIFGPRHRSRLLEILSGRRPFLCSDQNADEPGTAFVDDPFQRALQLGAGLLRNVQQLVLQPVVH